MAEALSFLCNELKTDDNDDNIIQHTTLVNQVVKVLYPFHPEFGNDVFIVSQKKCAEGLFYFYISQNSRNNISKAIPDWMLDPNKCPSGAITKQIHVSHEALILLKQITDDILSAWKFQKNNSIGVENAENETIRTLGDRDAPD